MAFSITFQAANVCGAHKSQCSAWRSAADWPTGELGLRRLDYGTIEIMDVVLIACQVRNPKN